MPSPTKNRPHLCLDTVSAIVAESGYEVQTTDDEVLRIVDLDSGLSATAALECDVVFFTLLCTTLPQAELSASHRDRMLDANNGISTSFFQTAPLANGRIAITLNNFAKLQSLDEDDRDDIEFCLESLFTDAIAARALLAD
jgi:hypothetical protein